MNQRWDIFCKIVDNFGDIGVCWRLAKQLRTEHGLQVKLWIDDFEAAKKIITHLDLSQKQQICNEIIITKWDEHADFSEAAEIVIEAFSCELPPAYLAAMVQRQAKWINLEYLSAEDWVDDFHAKPSPQANGLIRHFYFPGFNEKTGGLIREREIIEEIQLVSDTSFTGMTKEDMLVKVLKISLFCYPNAPVYDLFTALQASKNKVIVYVPVSGILPKISAFFGENKVEAGDCFTQNNLTVKILPFLSQANYDKLLSECDLNFVRGEDSWVRAIWAAKPFIWQPYFQQENTHIKKLDAFLEFFYRNLEQKQVVGQAHQCWAAEHMPQTVLQHYLNHLPAIKLHTKQQVNQLLQQLDLAAKLVIFCNKN